MTHKETTPLTNDAERPAKAALPDDWANATIVRREDLTPELAIYCIRLDAEMFSFKPGQYVTIGLPCGLPRMPDAEPEDEGGARPEKMLKRAYSIASSSRQHEYVELYVVLLRSGKFTPRLWLLRENDRIWMSERAKGLFTIEEIAHERDLLMVATGTGLAPYISMIRTYIEDHPRRRFVLLHGARHSWDLGYRAEIENLKRRHPNVLYLPTVSRPAEEEGWSGHVGRVQTVLADGSLERLMGHPLSPEFLDVLLCGNPQMIEEMEQQLTGMGFKRHRRRDPGNLHMEKYW